MLHGIGCRNIFATFADSDHQFDFVVEVFSQAGVGHVDGLPAGRKNQGVRWLQKKEGWFTSSKAHFFGMLFVIAAHAVNAVHRKLFCFSNNGNADNGWGREKVLHGGVERDEKTG